MLRGVHRAALAALLGQLEDTRQAGRLDHVMDRVSGLSGAEAEESNRSTEPRAWRLAMRSRGAARARASAPFTRARGGAGHRWRGEMTDRQKPNKYRRERVGHVGCDVTRE